jgi:hypothetical protein
MIDVGAARASSMGDRMRTEKALGGSQIMVWARPAWPIARRGAQAVFAGAAGERHAEDARPVVEVGVPVDGGDVLGLEGVGKAQVAVVGRVVGEAGSQRSSRRSLAARRRGDRRAALGLALAGLEEIAS